MQAHDPQPVEVPSPTTAARPLVLGTIVRAPHSLLIGKEIQFSDRRLVRKATGERRPQANPNKPNEGRSS